VRQTRRVIIVFPSEWKWSVYSIDKMPIHHHFLHDYSTLQCPSHTSINSNPYSRPFYNPFFLGGGERGCLFYLRECAIMWRTSSFFFIAVAQQKNLSGCRAESLRFEPVNCGRQVTKKSSYASPLIIQAKVSFLPRHRHYKKGIKH
jgi:hypothetical protein